MTSSTTTGNTPFGPLVRPTGEDAPGATVLYLHHGHDVSAGPEAALAVAELLAARTGATVLCAGYRPAYPEALEDVSAAYDWFPGPGPTVLAGERVGAWLATALLLRLRDSGAALPRCTTFVGALLDLTLDSRSLRLHVGGDPAFDVQGLRQRIERLGAKAVPTPLGANLHGLPPTQLLVAGTDPLLDDSLTFAARAAHDRVPVDLRVTADRASLRTEAVPAMADFVARWHAGERSLVSR